MLRSRPAPVRRTHKLTTIGLAVLPWLVGSAPAQAPKAGKGKPEVPKSGGVGIEDANAKAALKLIADADKLLVEASRNVTPEVLARANYAIKRIMETKPKDYLISLGKPDGQREIHGMNTGAGGKRNSIGTIDFLMREMMSFDPDKPITAKSLELLNPTSKIFGSMAADRFNYPLHFLIGVAAYNGGLTNRLTVEVHPLALLRGFCGDGEAPCSAMFDAHEAFYGTGINYEQRRLASREGWQNFAIVCGDQWPRVLNSIHEATRTGDITRLKDVAEKVLVLIQKFESNFNKPIVIGNDPEKILPRAPDFVDFKVAIEPRVGDATSTSRLEAMLWRCYQFHALYRHIDALRSGEIDGKKFEGGLTGAEFSAFTNWWLVEHVVGADVRSGVAELVKMHIDNPEVLNARAGLSFLGILDAAIRGLSPSVYWNASVGGKSRKETVVNLAAARAAAQGSMSGPEVLDLRGNLLGQFETKTDELAPDCMNRTLEMAVRTVVADVSAERRARFQALSASVVVEGFGNKKSKR